MNLDLVLEGGVNGGEGVDKWGESINGDSKYEHLREKVSMFRENNTQLILMFLSLHEIELW